MTVLENLYEKSSKKNRVIIDKLYLDFIHTRKCLISKSLPVQAHHVKIRFCIWGVKGKPADIYTFPLSYEYHTGGNGIHVVPGWVEKHEMDFEEQLIIFHDQFLEEISKILKAGQRK